MTLRAKGKVPPILGYTLTANIHAWKTKEPGVRGFRVVFLELQIDSIATASEVS